MRQHSGFDFSLIIPSRDRLFMLRRCLNSFYHFARDKGSVEVIILADIDDLGMRDIPVYFKPHMSGRVVFGRQYNRIIQDYNNFGAQCCTGKYLWMLNDDCEMTTPDWDVLASEAIERFVADKPDRLCYVQIDDDTHSRMGVAYQKGCCLPIITREMVDAMNALMPAEIDMWGADIWLWDIVNRAKEARVLDLIDRVKLRHHSQHNDTAPPDSTANRVRTISRNQRLTEEQIRHYVGLLDSAIEAGRSTR